LLRILISDLRFYNLINVRINNHQPHLHSVPVSNRDFFQ
jgi:hypothetical protein